LIILLLITLSFILLYLIYPFWLILNSEIQQEDENECAEIEQVSLIYLSQNGEDFLENKINFLLKELSAFRQSELLVIDDNSTDKSQEILNSFNNDIRVILKSKQKGIPHSMNLGVQEAKYKYIVFCDQRQRLSNDSIRQLVAPLKNKQVGAVSACISQLDNKRNFSILRAHENFIKSCEGNTGNLIGVYGPLYAVKKECYAVIPDYIILDDLYLTLKILRTHQVWFIKECQITEEDTNRLYNYQRTKRYLKGFLQLIIENELINQLTKTQITMLFWHKYLRLFIPVLLFIGYASFGFLSIGNTEHLIVFLLITAIGIISIQLHALNLKFILIVCMQINLLYLCAISELFFIDYCYRKLIIKVINYRF